MFHQDIPFIDFNCISFTGMRIFIKISWIDYSYYQDLYKKYIFSKFQYSIVYPFLLKTYKS